MSASSAATRRSFALVVLTGLAAGVVAAIAGNQAWVSATNADGLTSMALRFEDASAPPVTATALVLLAAWGVLLVTRGRFRKVMAWLGLLAAVAVLGFAVAAFIAAPASLEDNVRSLDVDAHRTVWSFVGLVAGIVALPASVVAVKSVRTWPEMGARYDSPVGAARETSRDNLDLWKDLDRGEDPTER